MLQRIYVNNFRCLVNFELKLDRLDLLLGINGSGKSSVFDVLRKLQEFILEDTVVFEAFPLKDKTFWVKSDTQSFEFDLSVDSDIYTYKLDVQHEGESQKCTAIKEELFINNRPLFIYDNEKACVYRDDYVKGTEYPFTRMVRSGVGFFQERKDNKLLTRFKQALNRIIIVRPIPALMEQWSSNEVERPRQRMEDFSSWYRTVSTNTEFSKKLSSAIEQVLPGFRFFDLFASGDKKSLQVVFNAISRETKPPRLDFTDLSDGQKMLVVLYTLLHWGALQEIKHCLFIDEPDNFVALREIQPWLLELIDECGNSIEQVSLISHHPGLIDYLGGDGHALWFYREGLKPVRVSKEFNVIDGLSLSETIARGWEE